MKKFYKIDEDGEYNPITNLYIGKDEKCYHVGYANNNYIIKLDEDTGLCELCIYEKPFMSPEHVEVDEELINPEYVCREIDNFMSARKFKLDENGCAVKVRSDATVYDLMKTVKLGGKRAVKTFYDYALSNRWEYFVTFTFDDEDIRNDKDLLARAWHSFITILKQKYSTSKALAVYELFKKGGYHLHALVGDCDLRLVPARNHDKNSEYYGDFLYSDFGGQIFNCLDWKYGFSTAVCIKPEDNQTQVVNYLSKYMTKASAAPYGCRRFFHTHNLNCRKSIVGYAKSFEEWTDKFNLKLVKDKNGIKVYRNYGTKFIEEKEKKQGCKLTLEDLADMEMGTFDYDKLVVDVEIPPEVERAFMLANAKQLELDLSEDNSEILQNSEQHDKRTAAGKRV